MGEAVRPNILGCIERGNDLIAFKILVKTWFLEA